MVLSTVQFVTLSFSMIFELFKTDVASKRKHPDVARFGVRLRLPVDYDILEQEVGKIYAALTTKHLQSY
ncbi:hypothetical protein ASG93_09945 [Paenibacillus sp. Soil787]|nr:hypothetical protein ASG93_09945 [Paenibacillus sp. Soil787]